MACLGDLNTVVRTIETTLTDGTTTIGLEGVAAEMSMDSTAGAILANAGDSFQKVDTATGIVEGVIRANHEALAVTTLTSLLTSLDVDTITVAAGVVTMVFNGTPDLSSVQPGDRVVVSTATNAENNGNFLILTVDDGTDTITYSNEDGINEATDSPAVADIDAGPVHGVDAVRNYCTCNGLCY